MYDVFEYNQRVVIAMELIRGGSLNEYTQKNQVCSVQDAIEWIKQILKGLSQIHQNRLIHRDIKPDNILLKKIDGEIIPVIIDLSIVQVQNEERLTRTQGLIGTLEYLSPEQIQGKVYDHRVDMYALGIMIYEMLTGQVPFVGNNFTIQKQHIESSPDWSLLPLQISSYFLHVLQKSLHKDAQQRFESSEDFLQALKKDISLCMNMESILPSPNRVARETQIDSYSQVISSLNKPLEVQVRTDIKANTKRVTILELDKEDSTEQPDKFILSQSNLSLSSEIQNIPGSNKRSQSSTTNRWSNLMIFIKNFFGFIFDILRTFIDHDEKAFLENNSLVNYDQLCQIAYEICE